MPNVKQGGITVNAAHELSIPVNAHAALERSHGIDETIPKTHVAEHQPYSEPSAKGHPALKHLSAAKHVHEVFKKR